MSTEPRPPSLYNPPQPGKTETQKRHKPQAPSKQHGKKRHVSRNTVTRSRLKLGTPA